MVFRAENMQVFVLRFDTSPLFGIAIAGFFIENLKNKNAAALCMPFVPYVNLKLLKTPI